MKEVVGMRSKKMAVVLFIIIVMVGVIYVPMFYQYLQSSLRGLILTIYILLSIAAFLGISNIFFIPNAVIVKDGENIILRNGWWKKKIPITNITRVELLSKERENTIKLLLNPETVRLYYKTEAGEKIYEVCDVRNKEKAIERLNELIAN